MVLVGNILCVCVCVLETFAMNGLWLGWGQMTAIFKEKGLFLSYCNRDENGTITECDSRDILFNTIYTTTSMLYALSSFMMGTIQVWCTIVLSDINYVYL